MDISIKKAQLKELDELSEICHDAYSLNFADHWDNDGLNHFLEHEFNESRLSRELRSDDIQYYIAYMGSGMAGFMKLNFSVTPPDGSNGFELEKIYFLPTLKGKGLGSSMIREAEKIGRQAGKQTFWLSVIDSNSSAIAFYKKLGFEYHSNARLDFPNFKEELRGMWRMYKILH